MGRAFIGIACVLCGLCGSTAHAQEVWSGDFETGDTSQYSALLNGTVDGRRYINVQEERVAEGRYAARVELHNDAVWPNGLKRVELAHEPEAARTAEGAQTFVAWSFFLPETLPTNPIQTIGYWESDSSYRQMMAFDLSGTDLTFTTRQPSNVEQWTGRGVVTPNEWHRIAMRVRWSTDAGMGSVDVWFDGTQVVTNASARTLADNNPHFIQIGLLRGAIEFADVPVIYLDDVVEGDSLADVRPDDLPGTPMVDAGIDVDAGTTSDVDAGEIDAGVVGADGGALDAGAIDPGDAGRRRDEIISGSSCAVAPGGGGSLAGWATLAIGIALVRRVRHRRSR